MKHQWNIPHFPYFIIIVLIDLPIALLIDLSIALPIDFPLQGIVLWSFQYCTASSSSHVSSYKVSYSDSLLSCFLLFLWYKRCMYSVELTRSSLPTSRISHNSSSLLKYAASSISTLTCLSSRHYCLQPSTSKLSPINYRQQNLNTISLGGILRYCL
jgi:hypothetical protein